MKLLLKRTVLAKEFTLGELYVDGKFFCYTLEDPVRNVKLDKETAIPFGKYKVVLTYSPRFKKVLPLLLKVPNFEGVRIHSGNTTKDTEGCILVGMSYYNDKLLNSREAMDKLMAKLQEAKSEITIEIV